MDKLIKRGSAEARAFRHKNAQPQRGRTAGAEAFAALFAEPDTARPGEPELETELETDLEADLEPDVTTRVTIVRSVRGARRADAGGKQTMRPKREMPEALALADKRVRARTPRFAPVTFSEFDGVRFLHFGTEWVQGAMRLRKPFDLELEYAQQMMGWLLFLNPPARVAQLGLGAASLTKWCHHRLADSRVEAVDLNPSVIIAARSMFALPDDDARLRVIEADAWDYVNDPDNAGQIGVLQVDLYDATARGPVLDSVAFYRACRATLSEPGMMTVNLFGDHPSFERNMRHLQAAFEGRVIALPEVHEGNRIVFAFSGPSLAFDWSDLQTRAAHIRTRYGLDAESWLAGLREVSPHPDTFII